MYVTVRLHAQAADLAGAREARAELAPHSTGRDVKEALARLHPGLAGLVPSCALANDTEYLQDGSTLADGDVLHLIPPVSGG